MAFQQHAGNISPSLPPYNIRATAITLTQTYGAVGISIRSSLCTHWTYHRTDLRKSRLCNLLPSHPPPLRARFWADCACGSSKRELERDQGLSFRDAFDAIDGLGRPRCRMCFPVQNVLDGILCMNARFVWLLKGGSLHYLTHADSCVATQCSSEPGQTVLRHSRVLKDTCILPLSTGLHLIIAAS